MILAHDVTGSGPPMLLVGGLAFDRRCWDRALAGLAAGRTVVRSELRGSGASAEPAGRFSNVDDLARLIEFVGLGPVAVVGLSMGGGIAARLAATRPELVSALVLVGAPSPGMPLPRDVQEGFLAVVEHGLAGDLAAARDEWMRVPFLRGCTPEVLADVRSMVDDYGGFHWRTRDPAEDARAAFRPTDIAAPTLVLWGEGEIPGLQTSCRALATAIPGAEAVVVEGAGHLVPMDAPAAFVDRVTAFLARRVPAAASQPD